MAVRMKYLGVQGAVVDGRVRDLAELQSCGLSVRDIFLFFCLSIWCSSMGAEKRNGFYLMDWTGLIYQLTTAFGTRCSRKGRRQLDLEQRQNQGNAKFRW